MTTASWIPRKYRKFVKEAWRDDDGYWVQLHAGYVFSVEGSTVISQDTIGEIKEQLATIKEACHV